MRTNKSIALDIGGSHITSAVVDLKQPGRQRFPMVRSELDAFADAKTIINAIGEAIHKMIDSEVPSLIGIAFPGPFIYDKGISAIGNVGGKFKQIFGLQVKEALRDISVPENAMISFSNDAHCFAVGANARYQPGAGSILFLTLGTGLGSAFITDGELEKQHPVFGAGDGLFDHSFADATADDYFSSRWFLKQAADKGLSSVQSVKQLAESRDETAIAIFEEFGTNLGRFLQPVIDALACTTIVIGGNIAKASRLFDAAIHKALAGGQAAIKITYSDDTEECILTGAALLADKEHHQKVADRTGLQFRKATQPLLPLYYNKGALPGYDVFPAFESGRQVFKGFDTLAAAVGEQQQLIIDGYGGVLWEEFREQLHEAFVARNRQVYWFSIDACLKTPAAIDTMIADSINGDDPVFGKKTGPRYQGFFHGWCRNYD